jgi:hypothetical protein
MNEYAISEYAPNSRDDDVSLLISLTFISTKVSHIKIAAMFIVEAKPIIYYPIYLFKSSLPLSQPLE